MTDFRVKNDALGNRQLQVLFREPFVRQSEALAEFRVEFLVVGLFNPKELFQKSLKPDSQFRNVIRSDEMQSAISAAFAQFAISNPTTEESRGARVWVEIFTNLAEPTAPPTNFPDKKLRPELMNPQPPSKKTRGKPESP